MLDFNTIIPEIINNGYSRIPVFQDSIDKVKLASCTLKIYYLILTKKSFDWTTILREPFLCARKQKTWMTLMQEFQTKKSASSYCSCR